MICSAELLARPTRALGDIAGLHTGARLMMLRADLYAARSGGRGQPMGNTSRVSVRSMITEPYRILANPANDAARSSSKRCTISKRDVLPIGSSSKGQHVAVTRAVGTTATVTKSIPVAPLHLPAPRTGPVRVLLVGHAHQYCIFLSGAKTVHSMPAILEVPAETSDHRSGTARCCAESV
jgi:hypothetical protein